MAADWARCRELSGRIREDLIHLGLVDAGRTIRIADGAEASAGDLIICRANDHRLEAGEPGRALANGDVLRIEAITRRGIMVRRLLDPDPATGIALITGTEDRQWLYPAMTRGTDANLAFVFTTPARPADSQPGTRPPPNWTATSASGANARDSRLSSPHQIPAGRSRASRSPCWPTS